MVVDSRNTPLRKPEKKRRAGNRNKIQYVQDIYEGGQKSAQINMMLCQAIALEDEHQFLKFLKNMTQILRDNPQDPMALRALSLYAGKEFVEVRVIGPIKDMRESINDALWFAIELGRESIGFDLIQFAKNSAISLAITEVQLQLLIKGEMYELIEDLIRTNVFLSIDETKISGMDLFEITKIQ